MIRSVPRLGVALFILGMLSSQVGAQSYPTKPLHFIFGFSPGTILDSTARPVADEMSKRLGQPIVFEFKPGASGTIAAKYVAGSAPDGYTFFYNTVTTNDPALVKNNAVAAATDLAPVSQFAATQYFLVARSSLPGSFQEIVEYSKKNPLALRNGQQAANIELYTVLLKARTGLVSESIPYKSSTDVLAAILSGDTVLQLNSIGIFLPHIEKGTIRPLFVAAKTRSPLLPNVPSSAELGIKNYDMAQNHGLWAPLNTPLAIRQRLSAEVARAVKVPAVADFIRKSLASEPIGSTPEEQLKTHLEDIEIIKEAARIAKFEPQ